MRETIQKAAGAPRDVAVGYLRGLGYPFRGMKFVFLDNPGLVRIWIFPILLTVVAMVLVMMGVWHYHDAFVQSFWEEPQGDGFWLGVARFFHGFLEILVAAFALLVGLVLVYLLTSIFAAPFNDALSEAVERRATGVEAAPFTFRAVIRDLLRTVGLEGLKLGVYLAVMGPLFLLSFVVPVAGQVIYSAFGFLFTATYWAVDYVDWPASRRNRGIGYRFGLLRHHFLPMLGFGTGVWIFLFVPLLNLLLMPAAVAGGTLLYLDLEGGLAPVESNGESAVQGELP